MSIGHGRKTGEADALSVGIAALTATGLNTTVIDQSLAFRRLVRVDLKTVQAQFGHSTIVLTADTYTSVLTDLLAYAAETTTNLVSAAAARNPGRRHRRGDHPAESAGPAETGRSKRLSCDGRLGR